MAMLVIASPTLDMPALRATAPDSGSSVAPTAPASGFTEYRYRIVGKLRMAVFWLSRDDFGSARMTLRADGGTRTVAFLAGSDPQTAPRRMNQWAYFREETAGDQADVFALHSRDALNPPKDAPVPAAGPQFDVACASVRDQDLTSTMTTVSGQGETYRMFDRLLNQIAASPQWERKRTRVPDGADAGFFTALEHVIRADSDRPDDARSEPVPFVYSNNVYDLSVRGRQAVGRTTVGTRTFERLTRADFAIKNRQTNGVSKFTATYSPDGSGARLPVQILYQPNFWVAVELRLDDEADVPADPATDGTVLQRMRSICDSAAQGAVDPPTGISDASPGRWSPLRSPGGF